MRKLTHDEIVARQNQYSHKGPIPLTVVLNNIRSLYNVGSIFRTADGAGVEKIWICGITGYPPNQQISKTALGAENRIPWEHHLEAAQVLREMKAKGYTIVMLEQMENSIPYHRYVPTGPTCLVIGNEITGISDEIVELTDEAVEIDMAGLKNSLNVSVAFGIAVYQLRRHLVS
jgi:tRNA G18 (ribose-2'-O)-methylase SpoU